MGVKDRPGAGWSKDAGLIGGVGAKFSNFRRGRRNLEMTGIFQPAIKIVQSIFIRGFLRAQVTRLRGR